MSFAKVLHVQGVVCAARRARPSPAQHAAMSFTHLQGGFCSQVDAFAALPLLIKALNSAHAEARPPVTFQ
jgi:hypothetical protein